MKLSKIVSGGQTGVDQGALDACRWIDFPYGGWVPKGRLTEAGPLPSIYKGMAEHSSADYLKRTEANVVDSDATLVMTHGKPTGGSKKTIEFAEKHKRPWHHVDMHIPMDGEVQKAVAWIRSACPNGKHGKPWLVVDLADSKDKIAEDVDAWDAQSCSCEGVLNVAGTRESKKPGIQKETLVWVLEILGKANGKCYYPPPMGDKQDGAGR